MGDTVKNRGAKHHLESIKSKVNCIKYCVENILNKVEHQFDRFTSCTVSSDLSQNDISFLNEFFNDLVYEMRSTNTKVCLLEEEAEHLSNIFQASCIVEMNEQEDDEENVNSPKEQNNIKLEQYLSNESEMSEHTDNNESSFMEGVSKSLNSFDNSLSDGTLLTHADGCANSLKFEKDSESSKFKKGEKNFLKIVKKPKIKRKIQKPASNHQDKDESLQTSGQNKNHECKLCVKTCKTLELLCCHVMYEHNMSYFKKYRCETCSAVFVDSQALNEHKIEHKDICPYNCDGCGKKFKDQDSLENHKVLHISKHFTDENVSLNSVFSCNLCTKSYPLQSSLTRHIRTIHINEEFFQCPLCLKEYRENVVLKRHMITHIKKHRILLKDNHEVNSCSVSENDSLNKNVHESFTKINDNCLQNSNSKLHCNQCEKTFKNEVLLNRHILKTHSMLEFQKFKSEIAIAEYNSSNQTAEKYDKCSLQIGFDNERFGGDEDCLLGEQAENTSNLSPGSSNVEMSDNEIIGEQTASTEKHNHFQLEQTLSNESDSFTHTENYENSPTEQTSSSAYHCNDSLKEENNLQENSESSKPKKAKKRKGLKIRTLPKIKLHKSEFDPLVNQEKNENVESFDSHKCKLCVKTYKALELLCCHVMNEHTMSYFRKYRCETCSVVFLDLQGLNEHKLEHRDISPYSCEYCAQKFEELDSLENHKKVVHNSLCIPDEETLFKNVFSCNLCTKSYPLQSSLSRHIKTIHINEEFFQCPMCLKEYRENGVLKRHMISHVQRYKKLLTVNDEDNPSCPDNAVALEKYAELMFVKDLNRTSKNRKDKCLQCTKCEKTFKYKLHLNQHILKTHSMLEFQKFKCEVCSEIVMNEDSLNNHKLEHDAEYSFQCDVCDKKYIDEETLNIHSEVEHRSRFSEIQEASSHKGQYQNIELFACEICSSQYPHEISLEKHQRISHKEQYLECPLCQKHCNIPSSLREHFMSHLEEAQDMTQKYEQEKKLNNTQVEKSYGFSSTGMKLQKCGVCSKICASLGSLKGHMRTHTGEKPHQCSVCGWTFAEKGNLNKHMLIHAGVHRYRCDLCPSKYHSRCHLTQHKLKVHLDYKAFTCEQCGMSFKYKTRFVVHMRSHTGETPFECNVCKKRFRDNHLLKNHMNIHNGVRFPCLACGKTYSTTWGLTFHRKKNRDTCGKAPRGPRKGNYTIPKKTQLDSSNNRQGTSGVDTEAIN